MLALRKLLERVDSWGKSAGKNTILKLDLKLEFPSHHFLESFPLEEFQAHRTCMHSIFLYFSPPQSCPDQFSVSAICIQSFYSMPVTEVGECCCLRSLAADLEAFKWEDHSASPVGWVGNSSGYSGDKNQGNGWT